MFTSSSASSPHSPTHARPLRVGFVALTDAAPFVAAEALGLFARHGVRVELTREIGWATIREKIIYGELDAAQAPAPMLWATQLGLGCRPCDVLTAFILNLHGNALTLSRALWEANVRDAVSLADFVRQRQSYTPLTFGAVFPFSSHHLMLREWLQRAGLEPDRDVRIVTVPPAQMFRNLVAGTLDGFCAGEPWNSLAVREAGAWCPTWSAAHQPGHVEKVLMVTSRFAEKRATEHAALVTALAQAAAWCDEPHHRERLAELLAGPRFLNLPAAVIAPTLGGRFDCGRGRVVEAPDFHVFHHYGANVPTLARAAQLQRALGAAGLLSAAHASLAELPARLFREDLHREMLDTHSSHELVPRSDARPLLRLSI